MTAQAKPRLAVFKFSSCDGCQLTLLNLEDELLALCGAVEIARFDEASSKIAEGPYDLALVEGSITTAEDVERIREVRKQSKYLVAIGACATTGGIQALRNRGAVEEYARLVYPSAETIRVLKDSTPLSAHVAVDFELPGCPVSKGQLLKVVTALLIGRLPDLPQHAVCMDCKERGTVCVLVAQGTACLGPLTRTGCGALCPSFGRGCYGCFGPMAKANTDSFVAQMQAAGVEKDAIVRLLRGFTGYAEEFRAAADKLEEAA